MPNALGFNELGSERACIELGCDLRGPIWTITEAVQAEHFLTHYREPEAYVNKDGMTYVIEGDVRVQDCRVCGNQFSQPRKRGRPKLECNDCKENS